MNHLKRYKRKGRYATLLLWGGLLWQRLFKKDEHNHLKINWSWSSKKKHVYCVLQANTNEVRWHRDITLVGMFVDEPTKNIDKMIELSLLKLFIVAEQNASLMRKSR